MTSVDENEYARTMTSVDENEYANSMSDEELAEFFGLDLTPWWILRDYVYDQRSFESVDDPKRRESYARGLTRERRRRWEYTTRSAADESRVCGTPVDEDDTVAHDHDRHLRVIDLAGNEVAKVPFGADDKVQIGEIRRRVFDWCGHWWFSLVDAETGQAIEGRDDDDLLDIKPAEEVEGQDEREFHVLIDIPESIIKRAFDYFLSARQVESLPWMADRLPRRIKESVFENAEYLVPLFAHHAKSFGFGVSYKDEVVLEALPEMNAASECASIFFSDSGVVLNAFSHEEGPRHSAPSMRLTYSFSACPGGAREPQSDALRRAKTSTADLALIASRRNRSSHAAAAGGEYQMYYGDDPTATLAALSDGAIEAETDVLRQASEPLKSDKEVVLMAIAQGYSLRYFSESMRVDADKVEVVLHKLLAAHGEPEDTSSECGNKAVILKAIAKGYPLGYVPKAMQADRDVVLQAVSHGRSDVEVDVLPYVSESLKDDKEVILAAVARSDVALSWASDALLDDKEFVLRAVALDGLSLRWVGATALSHDRDVVMTAVAQNGLALQDVPFFVEVVSQGRRVLRRCNSSESLKNDRLVVMKAVSQDGHALQYASETLKNSKRIVWRAISQTGSALQHASESLRNDRRIVLHAVSRGCPLQCLSKKMRAKKEIVLQAVAQDGHALEFASDALKDDAEVVSRAALTEPLALKYHASIRLRNCNPEEWENALAQAACGAEAKEHVAGAPNKNASSQKQGRTKTLDRREKRSQRKTMSKRGAERHRSSRLFCCFCF